MIEGLLVAADRGHGCARVAVGEHHAGMTGGGVHAGPVLQVATAHRDGLESVAQLPSQANQNGIHSGSPTAKRTPAACVLRGVIVPVVDLRVKLSCDTAGYNDFTVVIVLNVRGRVIGAVVDSVSDVLALGADSIKPAPKLGSAVDAQFILGMGCV